MVQPILTPGLTVGGRWRIQQLLGEGGFGQVFLAVDGSEIGLGNAALKVLHTNTSPLERKVFSGEVQRMAALRHQNLVGYLDSGQTQIGEEVHSYLVAEFCQGALDDFVRSQPDRVLNSEQLLGVLYDVASGLAYLHGKQMIHRDIKPANVLLGDGFWKLGDFGLTRDLTMTGSYHRGDNLTGTPLFMAPELFRTMTATAPSDIYAVGVLAHFCGAGKPLHQGTGEGLVQQIMSTPPTIDAQLDPAIQDIIYRCSMTDPQQRITAPQLRDLVGAYRSERLGGPPVSHDAPTVQYQSAAAPAVAASPPFSSLGYPPPAPPVGGGRLQDQATDAYGIPYESATPATSSAALKVAAAAVALVAAVAVATWLLTRPQVADEAVPELSPTGEEAIVATTAGEQSISDTTVVTSTDADETLETTGDAETGATEPAPDLSDPLGDLDPAPHIKNGCTETSAELGLLTNDHSAPLSYRVEFSLFDEANTRVSTGIETVRALGPGQSSRVDFGSPTDGAVGCQVTEISAEPTDPAEIDLIPNVEISTCELDTFFGDFFEINFTVTNPKDAPQDATVYLGVLDDQGVRVDEDWAGEDVRDLGPGQAAAHEAREFFSAVEKVSPTAQNCVVVAVEFEKPIGS